MAGHATYQIPQPVLFAHPLLPPPCSPSTPLQFYPAFLPVWLDLPHDMQKADALRYLILHRFGGIYMDADVACYRPAQDMLAGYDVVMQARESCLMAACLSLYQAMHLALVPLPLAVPAQLPTVLCSTSAGHRRSRVPCQRRDGQRARPPAVDTCGGAGGVPAQLPWLLSRCLPARLLPTCLPACLPASTHASKAVAILLPCFPYSWRRGSTRSPGRSGQGMCWTSLGPTCFAMP